MKRKNDWFIQGDVISLIVNHMQLKNEWTIVYESRESSLEHYNYLAIPVKYNSTESIFGYESWGDDDKNTLKNLLNFNGKQFLSLSFRRYFNLNYWMDTYISKSNEKYAIMEKDNIGGTEYKKCLIRTDKLEEYLRYSKQLLLFGLRSHRYSERFLPELGVKNLDKKFVSRRFNYILHYQKMSNRELKYRPHAKSMSLVFGKYIVSDDKKF